MQGWTTSIHPRLSLVKAQHFSFLGPKFLRHIHISMDDIPRWIRFWVSGRQSCGKFCLMLVACGMSRPMGWNELTQVVPRILDRSEECAAVFFGYLSQNDVFCISIPFASAQDTRTLNNTIWSTVRVVFVAKRIAVSKIASSILGVVRGGWWRTTLNELRLTEMLVIHWFTSPAFHIIIVCGLGSLGSCKC